MSKITKFFDIYGMKCHSCELVVEDEISIIEGIINVQADYKNSMVIVTYEDELCDENRIKNAIKNAGFSCSNNMFIKIISLSILIISMFFLGNNPLVGNVSSEINNNIIFVILFILGFLTSFHSIGSLEYDTFLLINPKNKKISFKSVFLYNSGRLISCTFIGGIVGAIGSVFATNNTIHNLLNIIVGFIMIISGLYIIGINFAKNITFPIVFKKSTCVSKSKKPFFVGYLSSFKSCIPLQIIQLYALIRGNFIMGALSMFVFILGTLPSTIYFIYRPSKSDKAFSKRLFKCFGILIIIFGIVMLKFGFKIKTYNL